MIDRTQPVPAPAGMKWTIHESMLTGAMFNLQLWDEAVRVDSHGLGWSAPLKKKRGAFAKGCTFPIWSLASEYATNERGIRRASKRAVRSALQKKARQAIIDARISRASE